jgi:hypothetical protein
MKEFILYTIETHNQGGVTNKIHQQRQARRGKLITRSLP